MKKEKTNRPKQPMNRRKKYLLLSGTTTLLIVVALVLVNLLTIYITDRYPVSIDLTPQKVFGLTEQSKEYLSKLEQPVSIQAGEDGSLDRIENYLRILTEDPAWKNQLWFNELTHTP